MTTYQLLSFIFLFFCKLSFSQDPTFADKHYKTVEKNELKVEAVLNRYNVSRRITAHEMRQKKGFPKLGIQFDSGMLPYRRKNKWGFIDQSNTIIVSPKYDSLFNGGLNLAIGYIKKDGYLLINKNGQLVNENSYERAEAQKLGDLFYTVVTETDDSLKYAFYSEIDSCVLVVSSMYKVNSYYMQLRRLKDKKGTRPVEIIGFAPIKSPYPNRTIKYVEADCYIIQDSMYLDSLNSVCYYLINAGNQKKTNCFKQYQSLSNLYPLVHLNSNGSGSVYNYRIEEIYKYDNYEDFVFHKSTRRYLHLKTLKENGWFNGFYNLRTKQMVTSKYRYLKHISHSNAFLVITEDFQLGYLRMDGTELF